MPQTEALSVLKSIGGKPGDRERSINQSCTMHQRYQKRVWFRAEFAGNFCEQFLQHWFSLQRRGGDVYWLHRSQARNASCVRLANELDNSDCAGPDRDFSDRDVQQPGAVGGD